MPKYLRTLALEASHSAKLPEGFVFRWTAHHVKEIFHACLPPKFVLDGSSKLQITCGPRAGDPKYVQMTGASNYYVDQFDFSTYIDSSPSERETMILKVLVDSFCDIVSMNNRDVGEIVTAGNAVIENNFQLSRECKNLRKRIRGTRLSVRVFRGLSKEFGESWSFQIRRDSSEIIHSGIIGSCPGFLDMRDFYKSATYSDGRFVIRDRLKAVAFSLDLAPYLRSD